MKEVRIFCGGQYIFEDDKEQEEEEEAQAVAEKIGREDKRNQLFLKGVSKYTKPYDSLSHPLRKARVREVAMETLFAVIDRKILKDEGVEMMQSSRKLAVDVCTFLDLMKSHLEMNFFKFNFDGLEDEMTPDFVGDEDVVENETESVGEGVRDLSGTILAESSRRGYDRIKKSIKDEFGVAGKSAVKTTYQIRKERVTIVSGLIDPSR